MSENREEENVQTKRKKKREKVGDVRKEDREKEMCKGIINKKN